MGTGFSLAAFKSKSGKGMTRTTKKDKNKMPTETKKISCKPIRTPRMRTSMALMMKRSMPMQDMKKPQRMKMEMTTTLREQRISLWCQWQIS